MYTDVYSRLQLIFNNIIFSGEDVYILYYATLRTGDCSDNYMNLIFHDPSTTTIEKNSLLNF